MKHQSHDRSDLLLLSVKDFKSEAVTHVRAAPCASNSLPASCTSHTHSAAVQYEFRAVCCWSAQVSLEITGKGLVMPPRIYCSSSSMAVRCVDYPLKLAGEKCRTATQIVGQSYFGIPNLINEWLLAIGPDNAAVITIFPAV